ncbi:MULTISPECIES: pectate lyase [Chryseobacterium]|uniref:PelA/Pel-15E family pectate lyase n=1 Tax=Chryseobacterium geocarposphaerae TaxID=1416776 RepID=A0ABU1L901_9FLAO|nr:MULTISPECIES: pectate lyase [Chryseobacterium]MDR6403201.1 PelA/Pel-15E family pectate lyase [Chryseobacterium geocarposphaerae]MDR6696756.1 PelA/Pel-15E family pectate lyase [Chryseobacterium ginsenosidimutans]
MMKLKISIAVFSLTAAVFSAQVKDTLAEKMLMYQLPIGGWSKQLSDKSVVNYDAPIDKNLLKKIKSTGDDHATIDNNATSKEINILIKSYKTTKNPEYLKSAEKGISYLLLMQYKNGGFPQYYPNSAIYRKQITYNDNAMINALTVLYNVAEGKNDFDVVDSKLKEKSKIAVQKGIECILKTQVLQKGIPSIWADQYNEITLQPDKARAFEPISLATGESVGIVKFLMMQPVTPEIEKSVKAAIKWFKANKIEGYSYNVTKQNEKTVRILAEDKNSVIWARFYDINTNKPLFGDRDGSVKYNYNEVSEERRNGYSWFGDSPEKLISKEFPKWLEKNKLSE